MKRQLLETTITCLIKAQQGLCLRTRLKVPGPSRDGLSKEPFSFHFPTPPLRVRLCLITLITTYMTSLTWKVAVVCTVRAVIIFLSGKNAFTNQNKSTSWGMTSNQYILSVLNYVYFMRTVGGERQITRLKLTIVQCETRIMERYSLFSWLFFLESSGTHASWCTTRKQPRHQWRHLHHRVRHFG